MGTIRNELEDLSFRCLEPEAYLALHKEVLDKAQVHNRFLEDVQSTIRTKLVENGIPAELEARRKSLYSVEAVALADDPAKRIEALAAGLESAGIPFSTSLVRMVDWTSSRKRLCTWALSRTSLWRAR